MPPAYRTESVVSADGTSIAYRTYGAGPGVVMLHGGAGAAQTLGKLAEALGRDFTVHVPDRRGRGRSGPYGDHHDLSAECADVDALLRRTGARAVFGLSAGAVIALYAAAKLSGIDKLALYEPPLIVDGARPDALVPRYERELDRGDLAAALVTLFKGTGDVGAPLTYAPRFLLAPLFRVMLRAEKPGADSIPLRELVPTLREDIKLVREASPQIDELAALSSDVLLLGGARSARDLRLALRALARRMPRAQLVVLAKVGHTAALDDGKPELVAQQLRAFFAAPARRAAASR